MVSKVAYVCASVLSHYFETGNDKYNYVSENIACSSETDLPYFAVEMFLKICIHCGASGTSQVLGNSMEHYPECIKCKDKRGIINCN